mmetsp:Transcript_7378/g.13306  ORF Transcript_7378/g.13306 Transcript_7378/m.13306 type:complete len:238 (-) Transcript_7378:681-1394(-)
MALSARRSTASQNDVGVLHGGQSLVEVVGRGLNDGNCISRALLKAPYNRNGILRDNTAASPHHVIITQIPDLEHRTDVVTCVAGRAYNCDSFRTRNRENVVFVLQQCNALSGDAESQGLVCGRSCGGVVEEIVAVARDVAQIRKGSGLVVRSKQAYFLHLRQHPGHHIVDPAVITGIEIIRTEIAIVSRHIHVQSRILVPNIVHSPPVRHHKPFETHALLQITHEQVLIATAMSAIY